MFTTTPLPELTPPMWSQTLESLPVHVWTPGPLLPPDKRYLPARQRMAMVCACGSVEVVVVDPLDTSWQGHRDFYSPDAHRVDDPGHDPAADGADEGGDS